MLGAHLRWIRGAGWPARIGDFSRIAWAQEQHDNSDENDEKERGEQHA